MEEEIRKKLTADPDGLLSYEYIANHIDTVESDLPWLVDNMIRVDLTGQFVISAARYLYAIDPQTFAEAIDRLIKAGIDKDRERRYLSRSVLMKHNKIFAPVVLALAFALGCGIWAYSRSKSKVVMTSQITSQTPVMEPGDALVDIKTSMGDIRVRLFGDTPRHRDNFLKLVKDGYYNDVLFHRVINEFMVQTGDPDSKNAPAGKRLGTGDPGYTLEAEIVYPKHFHHRGALAAARQGDQVNPQRRSSGSQFYIVTGKAYSEQQLKQMEQQMQMAAKQHIFDSLATQHRDSIITLRKNRDQAGLQALQEELIALTEKQAAENPVTLTDQQKQAYTTVGGTPHLDNQYTVFGEVVSGMDVVEKIEKSQTDSSDRPLDDIRIISMKVVKK